MTYFRVNAVLPTVIETDLVRKYIEMSENKAQGMIRNSSRNLLFLSNFDSFRFYPSKAHATIGGTNPMVGPNDPLPQVEDVSGVVAFLCGPDSKFLNGVLIPIDGGFVCQ